MEQIWNQIWSSTFRSGEVLDIEYLLQMGATSLDPNGGQVQFEWFGIPLFQDSSHHKGDEVNCPLPNPRNPNTGTPGAAIILYLIWLGDIYSQIMTWLYYLRI